jgi:glutamine amidotransferase
MRIVIIDYKMGNLRSVQKAFIRCGFDAEISSKPEVIKVADRLILPGVGHFNIGMESLKKLNIIEVLKEQIFIKQIPTLGICLGMQLLTNFSEEGCVSGLGFINADTLRFPNLINSKLKVPHIGWNEVKPVVNSVIFKNTFPDDLFYFVHSYYVKCKEAENILTTTKYGIEFHSAIIHENVIGMQFHPEKSHKYGLNLISNFIKKF